MKRKQSARESRTPLHYAAADSRHEVLAALIAEGADVNAQDSQGWSALHFAAQSVSVECAESLLAAGAKVDVQDHFGNTPLLRAVFASQGDGSVIKLLLSVGADPDLKNSSGVSAVSLARTIANYDVAQYFNSGGA